LFAKADKENCQPAKRA